MIRPLLVVLIVQFSLRVVFTALWPDPIIGEGSNKETNSFNDVEGMLADLSQRLRSLEPRWKLGVWRILNSDPTMPWFSGESSQGSVKARANGEQVPCAGSCKERTTEDDGIEPIEKDAERISDDVGFEEAGPDSANKRDDREVEVMKKVNKIRSRKLKLDSGASDGRYRMIHYFDPHKRGPGNCINNCVGRGIKFVRCKIICI